MAGNEFRKSNRLIKEKSPYLLQHAYNPVDWYPWGEEAFEKARLEDKPVFLSIGYSTCHWCHVMERESFEDEEAAELLNKHYISIKVDREERPDLDQIYMAACQALTGHGGWPLTVFLTPDKKPFYAGTYFPKSSRGGIPGMMELLPALASLWEREKEKVLSAGDELLQGVAVRNSRGGPGKLPGVETLELAYQRLRDSFDQTYGGFGGSPKFPVPHRLNFLLRWWLRSGDSRALDMVTVTLQAMARGGLHDQLGYGFHRYSTDAGWMAPHFEKMLYDQALLALAYLEYYQVVKSPGALSIARHIFEYVLRDLHDPEGSFFTAEDADSNGEEGSFYLWTLEEVISTLGEERGRLVADYYGITEQGNFKDGKSILHRPEGKEEFAVRNDLDSADLNEILSESRRRLLIGRSLRERPFRDDKVITGWNGLMIAALARGAAVLGAPLYSQVARAGVLFIREKLVDDEGKLLRLYRHGEVVTPAFLEDYAFLVWGLIELYQATFQEDMLSMAVSLNQKMLDLFQSKDGGRALNYAAADREEGLPAFQDAYDGAEPSGNSVAALNLLRLGRMTGRVDWEEKGEGIIRAFSNEIQESPTGFTFMLSALDFALGPSGKLVIAGDAGSGIIDELGDTVRRSFSPNTVILFHPTGIKGKEIQTIAPHIADITAPAEKAAAFLCRENSCRQPVSRPAQLAELMRREKLMAGKLFHEKA